MSLDRIVCAARDAARRAQRGVILGGILAVLVGTAFGFATAALYLALAGAAGALVACLAIAAGYLAVALLIVALARRGAPPPEGRPPRERPGLEPDAVSHLIATFLAGVRAGREGFDRKRR